MIFAYYSSGHGGQVLFDMNHLQQLTLTKGNLEAFHSTWTMVLSELEFPPSAGTLQFLYARQLEKFTPMAEDFNHYKRAKWNENGDHTFEWLWAASCRHLAMKREEYMQRELNKSLNGQHSQALAGPDAKPKAKPKAQKGKGDPSPARDHKGEGRSLIHIYEPTRPQ